MSWDEAAYTINKTISGLIRNEQTGIPPENMSIASLKLIDDSTVQISFQFPSDSIIDNQCICTVAGVRIVRKEGSAPLSPEDGVLVKDVAVGSKETTFTDSNVQKGKTYYYHFYPYSDHGVYNLDEANVKSILIDKNALRIFGFRQNFSDLNPDTTITYLSDCENSDYKPMMTNEGNGEVTAGSWESFLTDVLRNYPYMVKKTGEADYMLDPSDYTKRKSNGATSDYNNTSYQGGAFAWINKIYMKETYSSDGNSREVRFATSEAEGYYPIGFYDFNGNELDGVWIPMGYMDVNGKTLVAGSDKPINKQSITNMKTKMDDFWTQNGSSRAVFFGNPIINVLRDLEYMLFKSTNIQDKAGRGECSKFGTYTPEATFINGLENVNIQNGKVIGWYGTNDGSTKNKYFHSQVLGSYMQALRDPYTLLVANRIKTISNYKYDVTGNTYTLFEDVDAFSGNSAGPYYPSKLRKISDSFGSLVTNTNNGSTATGLCDAWYYTSTNTHHALLLGMNWNGDQVGPNYINLSTDNTATHTQYGCGVLLLPPKGYSAPN